MLEHLQSRFKPLLSKRASLVLALWGEAGIGKSYTATELLSKLPCQSLSLHSITPLPTLARTLVRPKKLASWAERILVRLADNEAIEMTKALDALGATLAASAPFVLHLEDLHEADAERLEFIQQLAYMVQHSQGLGLIVTSRNQPPEPFRTFRQEPLTREASDALLEKEVAALLPKEALEFIYYKAIGNPLYTLEYLRFLSRQGFLWSDGHSWHWRKPEHDLMPVTVEALIELSLDKIKNQPLLTILQTKAYLPLEASEALWQGVAEVSMPELAEAKLELQRQGIFSRGNFVHPLYREVTLKHLAKEKRQVLARLALEVLKDHPLQAAPFIADGALEQTEALKLLECASKTAKETDNKLQAGRLLAQASEYVRGEEKGRLALEAAKLLNGLDYPKMLELATTASSYLTDPAEALFLQAKALALQNNDEAVQKVLKRLPAKARQGKTWLERHIELLHLTGKREECIQVWESHPERHTCSASRAYEVGWTYVHLGNFEAASRLVTEWLTKPQLSGADKWSLWELQAAIAYYQGHYLEAETIYSDILALRQEDSTLQDVANSLRNRSMARLQLGRYRESLPDLQEALAVYSEVGNSIYYAQTLVMTSYVYQELGDFDKTEGVLLEALEIFGRVNAQNSLVETLAHLSSLYLEGSLQTHLLLALKYASEAFNVALKLNETLPNLVSCHILSCAKTATGQAAEGLELAEKALELARQVGFPEAVVNCTQATGLAQQALGQIREAKEAFRSACQLAEEHGLVLVANKYGLELDRLDNDLGSARKRMQWFEERGLMNGVNLAKRYFPELTDAKPASEAEPMFRIELLGSPQITKDKITKDKTASIRGRKRQDFLALLLEARVSGRSEVAKLTLLDTVYADEDELRASANLKNLVHGLRESFGEAFLITTATGYALGHCTSDVEAFLATGDTSLWRGEYLEGLTLESETVRESLYLTLHSKAQELLETDPKEAARVCKILTRAEPYTTDYLLTYFKALRASNNYHTLTRHYAEARERLLEVGEVLPETWQTFLAV